MRNLIVSLVVCLLFANCMYGEEERLTIRKDPNDPSRQSCDIIHATFTTPKAWVANKSDKNSYAILTRANETYPKVTQMITIDIGRPVAPTGKATAEAFAKTWNGKVSDVKVKVNGEEGIRVVIRPDGKTLRPVDCVVIVKDKRVFLLIGGAKKDGDTGKVLDELIKSWKWKNQVPQAQ